MTYRPVVLLILDGWGIGPDDPGNAITAAHTPTMDRLQAKYPTTQLRCSGLDVGLPDGQMGNSEVGHLNIGAGRIVYQAISRIDLSIQDGTFYSNPALVDAITHAKESGQNVHLIGLLGNGGVHAHSRHLHAMLELCKRRGVRAPRIHVITDGRDTQPDSSVEFLQDLKNDIKTLETGVIASVSGRYYAMDRDKRWDRTERAYAAIVNGHGPTKSDPLTVIQDDYTNGITDEFIVPSVITDENGQPVGPIEDGDTVIFLNFRADRVRQITEAFTSPDFTGFVRERMANDLNLVTMTEYTPDLPATVAFPPEDVEWPIARVISNAGLKQFHAAETEKYPHVTYFLNGGREEPFDGEDREMAQSPKVPTYDFQPEMSADEVTQRTLTAMERGEYGFIVVNFANGDMVGHTGVFDAAVKAIETVDQCVNQIVQAALSRGGALIVTADHGNADEMLIPGTDNVWTAHTMNPVPLVIVVPEEDRSKIHNLKESGILADIAPTVLELMCVEQPAEMTGESLIQTKD